MNTELPPLEEMMEDLAKTEGGQCFLASILPFLEALDSALQKNYEEQKSGPLNPYGTLPPAL